MRLTTDLSVPMTSVPSILRFTQARGIKCTFDNFFFDKSMCVHTLSRLSTIPTDWLFTDTIVFDALSLDILGIIEFVFSNEKLRKVFINAKFDCILSNLKVSCVKLQSLVTDQAVPSSFVIDILRACPLLTELSVGNVEHSVCHAVIVHGRSLTTLGLQSQHHCISRIMTHISDRAMRYLDADMCFSSIHWRLLKRHSKLPLLNFASNQLMSGETLCCIIKHCHEVKEIDIRNCMILSDQIVPMIAEYLPHLQTLNLSGLINVTSDAFLSLIAKCQDLKELHLHANGIPVDILSTIGSLKRLTTLNMSKCKLTNDVLLNIVSSNSNLTYLGLSYNDNLTDFALSQLGKHCPKLQRLHTDFVTEISDVTIIALSHQCIRITYLDMLVKNASESALIALVSSLEELTYLYLRKPHNATDRLIEAISVHCKRLKYILFLESDYVTVDAIQRMFQQLKRLRSHYVWLGNDQQMIRVMPDQLLHYGY